jgi:hypothetical protein
VVYPEENLLMGDNLRHCEAALMWLKNNASSELQIEIGKIFLGGAFSRSVFGNAIEFIV